MFPAYQSIVAASLEGGLALIAMNRPEAANALNTIMAREIEDAFASISREVSHCRAVILTGQGRNFCAGADLKERKGISEEAWHRQHETFEKALLAILRCPQPVIAAVNGAAFGGGLELALACDFIYAANTARFALTEATLGIMPGLGGTQHLPKALGARRAKEILFSGNPFSADDAYSWGLVNQLCEPSALLDETMNAARHIASNAPLAVRSIKKAVNEGNTLPLDEALSLELKYYNRLLVTKDRHEGINAFNEKRKPAFTGE